MDYRREIDGLRAVAVVPVILFHAGFSVLPGGFVGVDIFFVISGYLITTLLVQELDAGRYSLARFYERRARRILPALFVVIAATIPMSFWAMLPMQLEGFFESLVAVILFLSNLYFLTEVGYFAPDAELQPLLHTWSLAVEEQYYLLFPPLLALLWRRSHRGTVVLLTGIALASLALAEWGWRENAARSFFFTGTRAWELLVGSLVALVLHRRHIFPHQGAAALGLGLILTAMLLFDGDTPFPSLWALVPVIGAALVILFAGPSTVVGRVLGGRLLVRVGLISYSAYLWHQPLFAIARLRFVSEAQVAVMLALVVLTFALASATWAFVEQPFRRRPTPLLARPAVLFSASVVAALGLVGVASVGMATNGFDAAWRQAFPAKVLILNAILRAETAMHLPQDDGACRFNVETVDQQTGARLADCHARHGAGVAVLGDSHAIDLFGIVSARPDQPFVAGFTKPSCRPVLTTDRACPFDSALGFMTAHPDVFDLMLFEMSGAYLLMLDGTAGVQSQIERLPLEVAAPDLQLAEGEIDTIADWVATVSASLPIVWFGPRVEPQVQLQWLVGRGCDRGLVLRDNTEAPYQRLDAALMRRAADHGFAYLSQMAAFDLRFPRDLGGCDRLLWSDGDHFSAEGEVEMARRVDLVSMAQAALAARSERPRR